MLWRIMEILGWFVLWVASCGRIEFFVGGGEVRERGKKICWVVVCGVGYCEFWKEKTGDPAWNVSNDEEIIATITNSKAVTKITSQRGLRARQWQDHESSEIASKAVTRSRVERGSGSEEIIATITNCKAVTKITSSARLRAKAIATIRRPRTTARAAIFVLQTLSLSPCDIREGRQGAITEGQCPTSPS